MDEESLDQLDCPISPVSVRRTNLDKWAMQEDDGRVIQQAERERGKVSNFQSKQQSPIHNSLEGKDMGRRHDLVRLSRIVPDFDGQVGLPLV